MSNSRGPVREPAVAGTFYPARADRLRDDLAKYLFSGGAAPRKVRGIVAPHAGYVYSGGVAGATYARIEVPPRVILLAPNHTGRGSPISVWPGGSWQTPLGAVLIDDALVAQILEEIEGATADCKAHEQEHSAEVHVPFLQMRRSDVRIAVVVLGALECKTLQSIGTRLASICARFPEQVLVVASSDMNHYESESETERKDRLAIDRVLALDEVGLSGVIAREDISMCGCAPTIAMLSCAKALGATKAELVRHATSGSVSGDHDRVVGYAGILVY